MRSKRVSFTIEVFDVSVVVIVTTDIPGDYKREFNAEIPDTRMACVAYCRRKFVLFLEPAATKRHEVVAHEIFHLTHRIMEFCEMNFDSGHHEQGAYLCEYLTKKIFSVLKSNPLR